ncbi:hypothetical protein D0860_01351 [Hortaea werneckii]|uniref:Uncharacterized protein n=1 Tax=Hortaea werneckii TaxID=91943 RepID=A0A3M7HRW8_HORWE|nr:hypothetical protein D0860_01351 [Hortaea werneckii]
MERSSSSASSPATPPSPTDNTHEKITPSHIEKIPTHDRVPGHTNYYEKNGLRTYENPTTTATDPESHNATPLMTFRRLMSLTAMAFLWTGSQIPVYLFGGIPPLIYSDIGGADRWIWFVLANLLSLAALLFMAGMQWGGYQYSWGSAHVLAPLILGAAMLIGFCLWETYGATHPMFPKRLRQDPRILGLTLVITFISGANFL